MQNPDFEVAIDYVFQNEGKLVDNPHDHGGITNYGVTIPLLTDFRRSFSHIIPVATPDDIRGLDIDVVHAVYLTQFWGPLGLLEGTPQSTATACLDVVVGHGMRGGTKILQRCLEFINVDGVMGPKTRLLLKEIDASLFIHRLVGQLNDNYAAMVDREPSQNVFLAGWMNRANRLLTLLGYKI